MSFEGAANAKDRYDNDLQDPKKVRSSQVTGVSFNIRTQRWRSSSRDMNGRRNYIAYHTTEEGAASVIAMYESIGRPVRPIDCMVNKAPGFWFDIFNEDVPNPYCIPSRLHSSMWSGVCWDPCGDGGRWLAVCKRKYLGRFKYEDEEGAARAYNVEAKRIGLTELNDVPDAPEILKHDRFFMKGKKNQKYE